MIAVPPPVQRLLLGAITVVSRAGLSRRQAPSPVPGDCSHLTCVVRLPATAVPVIVPPSSSHYLYPPCDVHVTVRNLDGATRSLDEALDHLSRHELRPVHLTLDGLGCSPDTVFVRCLHDRDFAQLRAEVGRAFGVGRARGTAVLYELVSFANIVRFDGAGWWPGRGRPSGSVDIDRVEIVTTDRLLSSAATSVVGVVHLNGR